MSVGLPFGLLRGARCLAQTFEQHFSTFAANHQYVPADAQIRAVRELGKILQELASNRSAFEDASNVIAHELNRSARKESQAPPFSRSLSFLFRLERQPTPPSSEVVHLRNRGAYLYGPVGQGKTVLLDLFYDFLTNPNGVVAVPPEAIIRCHFHQFMLAVHQALHEEQQQGQHGHHRVPIRDAVERLKSLENEGVKPKKGAFITAPNNDQDLVVQLAKRMVAEGLNAILLDELQITNISDALICKRLFSQLFQFGVALVCTSNCPIDDLYQGGLNRDRFLEFLPVLRRHCKEIAIDTKRDLRMLRRQNSSSEVPNGNSYALLSNSFTIVTPSRSLKTIASSLISKNVMSPSHADQMVPLFHRRVMRVDFYNPDAHMAVVSFNNLCYGNTAPADFIALARHCSQGIWVHGVPRLDIDRDQEAIRRFINFIDVIYDENVPIVLDMAAAPLQLIQRTSNTPLLWGDLTMRMRQQASTFDEAWTKLFKARALKKEEWEEGCETLGLHRSQATILWSMMPLRGGLLCIEDVRNGMCLYLIYGVADTAAWTGELFKREPEDSNQMWTRSFLRFLCGADTPETFSKAVEAAGSFDGFPCSAVSEVPSSSSDVTFAVPRLLSRLIEVQKDYQHRHPLLCAEA